MADWNVKKSDDAKEFPLDVVVQLRRVVRLQDVAHDASFVIVVKKSEVIKDLQKVINLVWKSDFINLTSCCGSLLVYNLKKRFCA